MSKMQDHLDLKKPSEKSFGIVFSIVFLLYTIYQLLIYQKFHFWSIALSILLLILAYFFSRILILPNKYWFKFGITLGSIVSPIIISIIYFVTVIPTGVVMRLLGKDLLKQNFNKKARSYWVERNEPIGSMKNQF
jgi:hypothetical protein